MLYAFLMAQTIDIIISILITMLFARIIIGLFVNEGSPLEQFLAIFTEPVVYPMRKLLSKNELLSSIPVDFSMQFSLFALVFISFILMIFQG